MLNEQETIEFNNICEQIIQAKQENKEEITIAIEGFSTEIWELLVQRGYEITIIFNPQGITQATIKWGNHVSLVK